MDIFKNNIDFNMYKVFYAVAFYESFSKAAKEICVSQPAISYTIKRLEEELGVKLFIRLNKGIILTEEGKRLKFYVENAFNNLITGYKSLKENEEELTGEISIGIHSNIGTLILPKYIKKFQNFHPNVKITIFNSTGHEMRDMFKNRNIDLLILHYPIFTNSDEIYETKILSLESCFFGTRKYYDSFIISQKENALNEFPLLLPMKGFTTSTSLDKMFKKNNMILKSNIYLYSTEMTISLAKEGLGIAWGLKENVIKELEDGTLYEIPLNIELPKIDFSIAYNEKYVNKTAKKFAEFLIEELKK